MSHSRWNLLLPVSAEYISQAPDFSPLVVQLLYNRGLTEPSQLRSFLGAGTELSFDPNLLPGMHQAVARLYRALLSNEKIAVYGDFDTDGITATALVVQGLSLLDCEAVPYIPHRMTEGYGLKTAALEKLQAQGVSLVVTVDCGITAVSEVKKARRSGLDIIITDHHTPPLDEIPPACAVINPKLADSPYPFRELAGVGVAYKLLQALFRSLGKEEQLSGLTDLVALGTVADMVPLLGENRYFVKDGLGQMSNSRRTGIVEMIEQCGLDSSNITSENVSWKIAPRLNAAGRLEHAMGSYKLLMTDSKEEAQSLGRWLEQKNAERQRLTVITQEKAREQVLKQGDAPILIVGDNDFPAGIVGLVAGRLVEEFYRPVIVLRTTDHLTGGSCRSIPEFDIIQALNRCSDLLTHYGGHSRAAGLSLRTQDLPRLREKLIALATSELEGVDLRPRVDIDADVELSEMNEDTFNDIQKLAPFGQGNPAPTLLSRGVEVLECITMGNGASHLRFKLRKNDKVFDGVGFGLGGYINEMSKRIDIVYRLEMNRWRGRENLRLNLTDFEAAK